MQALFQWLNVCGGVSRMTKRSDCLEYAKIAVSIVRQQPDISNTTTLQLSIPTARISGRAQASVQQRLP